MKKRVLLKAAVMALGVAGGICRSVALSHVDSRGLVMNAPLMNGLTFGAALLVLVLTLIFGLRLPEPVETDDSRKFAGFGAMVAGVGLGVAEISRYLGETGSLSLWAGVLGVLAAICLFYAGFTRFTGRRTPAGALLMVNVYFLAHLIWQYRQWSWCPQLVKYALPVIGSAALLVACYQRCALLLGGGSRKRTDVFSLLAAGACLMAIPGQSAPFYGTMVLWMLLDDGEKDAVVTLPGPVKECLDRLEKNGYAAYAVGGCVRDALMGREPHDYDLCTAAKPDEIQRIFADRTQVLSGLKHGTVGISTDIGLIEITTFRTEGTYSDARHPDWVAFVEDIDEDLARRDFTVNAMAYSPRRGLRDPFGGAEDLKKKILRAVGDPERRFTEDALRILRGVRFSAREHLKIEENTEKCMFSLKENLNLLARERVYDELCKLITLADTDLLLRYGPILAEAVPVLKPTLGFDQHSPHHVYDVYGHTARVVAQVPSELVIRWAALLHDVGKPVCFTADETGRGHFHGHAEVGADLADRALRDLKAPTALREQVVTLIRLHMTPMPPDRKVLRRRVSRYGMETVERLLTLQEADFSGKGTGMGDPGPDFAAVEAVLERIRQENACLSLRDLAVKGSDLMDLGFPAGKELGACLDYLLSCVVEETLPNDKIALAAAALRWRQEQKMEE